jgi:voltage-gated potassium channel
MAANPGSDDDDAPAPLSERREKLWRIIFLSDTPMGRAFDIALLVIISLGVLIVMLESVETIATRHSDVLRVAEWTVTVLFTIELALRLWVVRRPRRYVTSFFGVIDILSVIPTYLSLVVTGTQYLVIIRVLRLFRMFRILKMAQYLGEAAILMAAIRASRRKITLFLVSVVAIVCVEGTIVYVIETNANPDFSSIPQAMYWAVVTLTTVGYGDVAPVTVLGKLMASIVMLTGFAIIAVPTGIMTAELGKQMRLDERTCGECGWAGHDMRASFCQNCGTKL